MAGKRGQESDQDGGSDPARSIALLWGLQKGPTRGPRPSLSVARIVAAAVALADADGLAGLSMRRVAERVGASPMALYTYVPAKAELVDLMVDAACAETARPDWTGVTWRARLEQVAQENWRLFRRHPWLLQVAATTRPPLGPNVVAKYDHELHAVDGIGLTEVEMDSVLSLILGLAETAARRATESSLTERRTGLSDDQWWRAAAPILEQVFDPARFPTAARVGAAAGAAYNAAYDPAFALEFGLARVLDGVEALVRSRSPRP